MKKTEIKRLDVVVRKQGRCVCNECGKAWKYDYKEKADTKTLNMGHTNGFIHYLHCFEHKEQL